MLTVTMLQPTGNQTTFFFYGAGLDPAAFLRSKYVKGCILGLDNLLAHGTYRLQGWEYDLRPWLSRYLYKQAGEWRERYAPSRGALRAVVYGKILESEPRGQK